MTYTETGTEADELYARHLMVTGTVDTVGPHTGPNPPSAASVAVGAGVNPDGESGAEDEAQ